MRLHVLAAGQADALVLELPSGRLAVVDFGHTSLLDYLDDLDPTQSKRFAFCVLTHAHHDHYARLEEFIRRHDARVDEYWFSFVETSNIPALLALRAAAARGGRGRLLVQDTPTVQSIVVEPDIEILCFAPNTSEVLAAPGYGSSTVENNRSIVVFVRHGQATILLGADAEEDRWRRVESQARATGLSLAAHVIKAPHHGAAPPHGIPHDMWPTLLQSPDTFAVFSVGRRAGKPALDTIAALRGRARIRCTGRSLTCRPLHPLPITYGQRSGDLIARVLPLAPEDRPVQSCFGTQVYDLNPTGTVALVQDARPAFLDACLTHQ